MRIEVISPNPEVEPQITPIRGRATVMPSILAGSLDQVNPNGEVVASDLRQRAQGVADATGNPVIALQRLTKEDVGKRRTKYGLLKPYSPNEYDDVVGGYAGAVRWAMDSASLDSLDVLAVSAGGPVGFGLAHGNDLPVNNLYVFDSTAMRRQPDILAVARYGLHFARHEIRRPKQMRNQHPLPYPVSSEAGVIPDMLIHRLIWNSARSLQEADVLARNGGPEGLAVRMYFAERSFTVGLPNAVRAAAESLNLAAAGQGSDFEAKVAPVHHTITDDYAALVRVMDGTITEGYIQPTTE